MKVLYWVFSLIVASFLMYYPASGALLSQDSIYIHQSVQQTQLITFDKSIIEEFRTNSNFKYDQPPDIRPNFLQVMFRKFFEWLIYIFGNEEVAWAVIILLVVIGIGGLALAIYGIFGVGKTIPMYSKEPEGLDYAVAQEDIHALNFVDEIELAVEQKNYKKAIRLLYLYTLKLLTDRKVIDWKPSKTNHDYMYEIQSDRLKEPFSKLSYYFEYVWYGDFQADAPHYAEMDRTFSGLKHKLQKDA